MTTAEVIADPFGDRIEPVKVSEHEGHGVYAVDVPKMAGRVTWRDDCPVTPLGATVILRRADETDDGFIKGMGILLPESAKRGDGEGRSISHRAGVVVAVGPGELTNLGERVQLHVKVGDIVLYIPSPRAIVPLKLKMADPDNPDGRPKEEEFLFTNEQHLICIVHTEEVVG